MPYLRNLPCGAASGVAPGRTFNYCSVVRGWNGIKCDSECYARAALLRERLLPPRSIMVKAAAGGLPGTRCRPPLCRAQRKRDGCQPCRGQAGAQRRHLRATGGQNACLLCLSFLLSDLRAPELGRIALSCSYHHGEGDMVYIKTSSVLSLLAARVSSRRLRAIEIAAPICRCVPVFPSRRQIRAHPFPCVPVCMATIHTHCNPYRDWPIGGRRMQSVASGPQTH